MLILPESRFDERNLSFIHPLWCKVQCDLKFLLSMMMAMGGNIPDVNDTAVISVTSTSPVLPQTAAQQWELLCDTWDAARPLHNETHLHVREAVLFSLGAPLVCCGHVQVEAQRHRLLPQLWIPSEEGALPLLYHLVDLLCPGKKKVESCGKKRWLWYMINVTQYSVLSVYLDNA